MQGFVEYVRTEMLTRIQQTQKPEAGLVPLRRPVVMPTREAAPGKARGKTR